MIQTEKGKKFTLEKSVSYQKKAVVSNTVLAKKNGNNYCFCF